MDVLTRTKLKLAKMLNIKYASVETDKGPLEFDGEELTAGALVFQMDENGNLEPAADGDYTLEDGRVATVKDGEVAELTEAEGQEEEAEMNEEEAPEEGAEGEVTAEEFNDLVQIVNSLNTEVMELREKLEALEAQAGELEEGYCAAKAELARVKSDFKKAVSVTASPAETGSSRTVKGSAGLVDEKTEKAIKFMAGK